MKKFIMLFAGIAILIFASCSSSRKITKKTASGETREEFIIPCADFSKNTKDYSRATASATSPNHQFAKDKANGLARNALAQKIEINVNSLFDSYANQYDVGNKEDFKEVTKAITRQVTDKKLSGINVICEKSFTLSSGVYEVWVGIEMSVENVGKSVYDEISNEKKIRLDYDYEKFKEELQKEIEKLKDQ